MVGLRGANNTRGSRVGVVVGVDYDCVCPPLYSRVHFRTAHARLHRANNSAEILVSRANFVGRSSSAHSPQPILHTLSP